MTVTMNANAKINLMLDLNKKLPDGYHAINTVMQSISLYDTVKVSTNVSSGITVLCSDKSVPCNEKNTAYKAALLFFDMTNITPSISIEITKRIPSLAGLGGGSADAAAVLFALNDLYNLPLEHGKLTSLALKTGADVPFCVAGGTCLCLNKGEIISPLPLFDSYIVIVKPNQSVSTKEAFDRYDSEKNIKHADSSGFLYYAALGDYKNAFGCASNIFEQLTVITDGESIKKDLTAFGASYSALSGSGSAYFGLFSDRAAAQSCADKIKNKYEFVCVCNTSHYSVEKI